MESLSWDEIGNKRKVIFAAVSAAAIIWIFNSFLLAPQRARIEQVTAQYCLEKQQLKDVENFAEANPKLSELDSRLTKVNKMLPNYPDISTFLIDIEGMAKECGVQIISIKPGQIRAKGEYQEYDIEMVFKGTYIQNMFFFEKSEKGQRFTEFSNVSMKVCSDGLESKTVAKIYSYGVLQKKNHRLTKR